MLRLAVACALLVCASAFEIGDRGDTDDDVQQVQQFAQSVKGGWGGQYQFQQHQNHNQNGFGYHNGGVVMRHNLTLPGPRDLDVGVCYIEVPTATLVRGSKEVPVGNGSRADLSRIRSCCKGYIRNIHNFRKCDPVCTEECINAQCTAPETCTCFPDHVKNLGGICIPTCPIGCQHGDCAGGECLCRPGYKLDRDSKFCVPECKENCGGIGNCTAPNTCECKNGYQTSTEGSCKPVCDNKCANGDCVAPNDCRCHQGFTKNQQGICAPQCGPGFQPSPQGCKPICSRCTNGECTAPETCKCNQGYAAAPNQPGSCVAQCSPRCTNGDCIAPDMCKCHQGYAIEANQPGVCVPQCNPPCQNGHCVSPNVCEAKPPGQPVFYQAPNQPSNPLYPDNQLGNQNQQAPDGVPQCLQPCLNGVCVGNNVCSCNNGYILDRTDPSGTRCIPHCPGGCSNGICSAPNFCICNMGYYKDRSVKGRPTCVKRDKRSADLDEKRPSNVAELLIFNIPDY